ncbi:MAG: hypothetical protein CBC01_02130 [Betaproteobacteria bacterium TMED41]|nr:MAG: hypothetical protein CBC01_02130 [Betaproteobacteria bacterium TMED41]|tara:strand:+ start:720 stop:1001 length:282 start_codon:yes stop_codon:yes gene_type:complete
MSGPETYKLAKKLPDYGIYGLVYLSGSSILYGNEFFSKGAPSISIDIVAYSIMLGSLLSFLSVYLLIEKLQKRIKVLEANVNREKTIDHQSSE